MTAWDAVVVGAGPAGSAAATVLSVAGRRVLLLEKDCFPRAKVCGEFLSGDALASIKRLGARGAVDALAPERIEEGSVHPARGEAVPFRLPTAALGISRFRLDELLASRAREAGAEARFSCRVLSTAGSPRSGFSVRFVSEGVEEEAAARAVIGAWGRWDALDRRLERTFLERARFFGFSRDYRGDTSALAGRVRLYLFPGGYCGLSRVEGGEANLAGVISESERRKTGGSWEDVLRRARRFNAALEADLAAMDPGPRGFLGTVPVVFTAKPATEDGMLMAGDAAGVLDPFSGQGQAAALAAGILAGDTTLDLLVGRLSPDLYLATYERAWRTRFSRRFGWSAALRRLILGPLLGRIASGFVGERTMRYVIRKLWGIGEVES
ncbi:MAG: FAD-dependent monooxygenase [Acidobacteria bacterium]|nr:FAD-dependent monooxygenase [Acidobacteriota bacterium]MCA1611792.1 FAD-dependent monooxygenase [Acidobacteriota bacterium]MCA1617449.1 FAD-dependent monooxygenase [Acidobacteriota bacterium]